MLLSRIIGAFEFRRSVYAEVEEDRSFTNTAWVLVVVSAFLNQVGSHASANLANWLISAVVGTITSVLGFALAALIIDRVGRALFGADVTFNQLVRTLGLAFVWNAIGVFGIFTSLTPTLSCVLSLILFAATVLLVIAWFVAAHEALDLPWGRTLFTVVLGWIIFVAIVIGTRIVLGRLGLSPGAAGALIGF